MDKLGVAILGLDHWYWAFDLAQQAAQGADTRLVAISHDDVAKGAEVAQRHGAEFVTDYRAALDRPDVQIVAVTYSTDRSAAILREATALGKHILSIKPIALDLVTADAIVAAIQSAGVHCFPLECAWRLIPERIRFKQWLDEGRIGKAVRFSQSLHVGLPQAWPGNLSDSGWWVQGGRVPGGGWLDHAIYAIDYARWLFGAEAQAVRGFTNKLRYPHLPFEDYGMATFNFPDGQIAQIEDTWTADRGAFFNRSELVGTAGALCDDTSTSGRIQAHGSFAKEGIDGWLALEPLRGSMPTMEHFASVVRGDKPDLVTVQDARANLAACLAFYEAARTGTTVNI